MTVGNLYNQNDTGFTLLEGSVYFLKGLNSQFPLPRRTSQAEKHLLNIGEALLES